MSKWSKPDAYGKCLDDLLVNTKSSNVKKRHKINTPSPFHDIETELYSQFLDNSNKGKKVTSKWLRINDLKIFNAKNLENQSKWGITYLK